MDDRTGIGSDNEKKTYKGSCGETCSEVKLHIEEKIVVDLDLHYGHCTMKF